MTLRFGLLCFPNVQQLDLTAPYEVFASVPGAEVHLVWKDLDFLRSATGLWLKPTVRFADAPDFDVICVPGGAGVNALFHDKETLDFLKQKADMARFVTSVCTGALVLGQAGLLSGRRATTHWNALDFLAHFGATAVNERVVQDGTLITAGGVTSGIDFGLAVIAQLLGQEDAEAIQLSLEYAPAPPFGAGLPETASAQVLAMARARMQGSRREREALFS
ncbi:AraC family transcriptional regulator [Rhizobium rhizosphaerae]|uniref:AraC family transcriptional regulator n=1 Tax=Xaviernesmea rhizosphaerae TaxID=1672749 RepID=A0ABX3P8W4_9HYPH|nr:DJ-1/PfpI family protein [Xaviernesmea rhizosphaerae]OQP83960.1 AraC family transcriptional regulator [Xaviernesmea rhizosphaerae]